MPMTQPSILATRYGITTPEGSRLSRRTVARRRRDKKMSAMKRRHLFAPLTLTQVNIDQFLKKIPRVTMCIIKEEVRASTPELIDLEEKVHADIKARRF